MITVFRDFFIKNKAYQVLIWILVVTLVLSLAIPGLKFGSSASMWVAKVNGNEISYTDFARKANEQEYQLQLIREQYGQYADLLLQQRGLSNDPKVLALDSLVQDELLNQAASNLDIHLSEDYISEKLADVNFVRQGLSDLVPPFALDPATGINMQQLKPYLHQIELTLADFDVKVQQALLRYLFQDILAIATHIPLFELQERYKTDYLGKNFSVITVPFDLFLKKEKQQKIAQAELQGFFDKQSLQQRYKVAEKRNAMVWQFDPANYGISVSDEAVEAYYKSHKSTSFLEKPSEIEVRTIVFAIPDEQKAQEVYQKAKTALERARMNPADFANLAKELSQDKESAKQGGLIPAFAKGSQEPTFDRAAFLLKNDSDISEVIRTPKGFEIIQRVGKKAPTYKALNTVKAEIKALLLHKEFGEQFAHDMGGLVGQSDLTSKEFENFVAAHSGRVKNHNGVEKSASKLAQLLFDLRVNELSFYVDEDAAYAVKLLAIDKAYQPKLEAIQEEVESDLYQERALKSFKEAMKMAQAEARTKSFDQIATQLGATIKQTGMVKKSNEALMKSMAKDYPLESMLQLEKTGLVSVFGRESNGYVVKVDEVESFDEKDFEAKKTEILASLIQERVQAVVGGFVASLYRNATIKPNETLFNNR